MINTNKENLLNIEDLSILLSYNKDTGIFTSLVNRGKWKVGSIVGSYNNGYLRIVINGHKYQAHRLAWFYMYKKWPENFIDHIDGNRSNNSLSNLREATNTENSRNTRKVRGLSKYKGIYNKSGLWVARIRNNNEHIYLGTFKTEEEAAIAYNNAATIYHGEFAVLNNVTMA